MTSVYRGCFTRAVGKQRRNDVMHSISGARGSRSIQFITAFCNDGGSCKRNIHTNASMSLRIRQSARRQTCTHRAECIIPASESRNTSRSYTHSSCTSTSDVSTTIRHSRCGRTNHAKLVTNSYHKSKVYRVCGYRTTSKYVKDSANDQTLWTLGCEEPRISGHLTANLNLKMWHTGKDLDSDGRPITLTQGGKYEESDEYNLAAESRSQHYKDFSANMQRGDYVRETSSRTKSEVISTEATERQYELGASVIVSRKRINTDSRTISGTNDDIDKCAIADSVREGSMSEHDKFYAQFGAVNIDALGTYGLQLPPRTPSVSTNQTRRVHTTHPRYNMLPAPLVACRIRKNHSMISDLFGTPNVLVQRSVHSRKTEVVVEESSSTSKSDAPAIFIKPTVLTQIAANIWPKNSSRESTADNPFPTGSEMGHTSNSTHTGSEDTNASNPKSTGESSSASTGTVSDSVSGTITREVRAHTQPIQSAFPTITHAVSVVRSYSAEHAEKAIREHIMPANPCVLGFDIEWDPHGDETPTLLQVSLQDTAYLFHLAHYKSIPPALKELCITPNILKAGHGVAADALKLYKSYGIQTCGLVEICNINKNTDVKEGFGLSKAALASTNLVLLKSKKITMSNWAKADLTDRQIYYAAQDAWIGARILDHQYRTFGAPDGLSMYQFVVRYKGLSGPSYRDVVPLGMNHFEGFDLSECIFHPMKFEIPPSPYALKLKIVNSEASDPTAPPKGRPRYSARSGGKFPSKPRPQQISAHRVVKMRSRMPKVTSIKRDKYK